MYTIILIWNIILAAKKICGYVNWYLDILFTYIWIVINIQLGSSIGRRCCFWLEPYTSQRIRHHLIVTSLQIKAETGNKWYIGHFGRTEYITIKISIKVYIWGQTWPQSVAWGSNICQWKRANEFEYGFPIRVLKLRVFLRLYLSNNQ